MIAVSAGRTEIANVLMARGAQVNSINSTGQCPLHYASSKNRFEVKAIIFNANTVVPVC